MTKLRKNKDGSYRSHGIDERFEQPARTRDAAAAASTNNDPMQQFAHLPEPPWSRFADEYKLSKDEIKLLREGVQLPYILECREHPSWPKRPAFFKSHLK